MIYVVFLFDQLSSKWNGKKNNKISADQVEKLPNTQNGTGREVAFGRQGVGGERSAIAVT